MNSNEEKSFTADEVNKIVEERLSRERKQGSSLAAVKELLKSLKAEGILKGESISELASELMALVSERTAEASAKAPEEVTMIRIHDTLAMDTIWVSENLLEQVKKIPGMEILSEAEALVFDANGNLFD